jgi:hypothetical protein
MKNNPLHLPNISPLLREREKKRKRTATTQAILHRRELREIPISSIQETNGIGRPENLKIFIHISENFNITQVVTDTETL